MYLSEIVAYNWSIESIQWNFRKKSMFGEKIYCMYRTLSLIKSRFVQAQCNNNTGDLYTDCSHCPALHGGAAVRAVSRVRRSVAVRTHLSPRLPEKARRVWMNVALSKALRRHYHKILHYVVHMLSSDYIHEPKTVTVLPLICNSPGQTYLYLRARSRFPITTEGRIIMIITSHRKRWKKLAGF